VTVSETDGLSAPAGIAHVGAAMLAMSAAMMMRFMCLSVSCVRRRKPAAADEVKSKQPYASTSSFWNMP
jgi:hypothetical protein